MSPLVTKAVADGVATITLDSPDNRNALSAGLVDGLGTALTDAIGDPDVRVIVVTNTGTVFSAGADLKNGGLSSTEFTFEAVLALILDSPKPVIGRIAGHCAGGGVGLAAACDISVMDSAAKLAFSEARVGVAPAIISVVCLPKMRRGDAAELFLRAERITAERAVEVGLVNHAVAADELDATVEAIVDDCRRGGPNAIAACKTLLTASFEDRAEWFAWAAQLSAGLFGSDEGQEGMAAFREKRSPRWVGEA